MEGGREYNESIESKQEALLEELDLLLAELVEKGAEFSSDHKQALRARIQACLAALKVNDLDDIEGLMNVRARIHELFTKLPTPEGYPNKENFTLKLQEILNDDMIQTRIVPERPRASDISNLGKSDWDKVRGRGKETEDYLYDLGKIMSSEFLYTSIFDEEDSIEIRPDGEIENGRHRTLTLKVLGEEYIVSKNMDKWVVCKKFSE